MKKFQIPPAFLFFLFVPVLTGCDLIAGIFKAGVWVGAILVILVVVLIIWILRRVFR